LYLLKLPLYIPYLHITHTFRLPSTFHTTSNFLALLSNNYFGFATTTSSDPPHFIVDHGDPRRLHGIYPVDGKACHEYHDESNDEMDRAGEGRPPQVSNYIEAVAGAHFAVRVEGGYWLDFGSAAALDCDVSLDGWLERLAGRKESTKILECLNKAMSVTALLPTDSDS
jgi:hypothetical protein